MIVMNNQLSLLKVYSGPMGCVSSVFVKLARVEGYTLVHTCSTGHQL